MAEIKNTFLKSKMNKDLDARLLPNGEYRDAQNINISRSEGPDVGAIENVLGNIIKGVNVSLKEDIAALERQKVTEKYGTVIRPTELTLPNLEVIGYYMDIFNDKIYLFLTDYTDGSNNQLSNFAPADYIDTSSGFPGVFIYKGAGCYIAEYNVNTNTYRILVAGNFLNFSKTQPILNVNLLEDLLFWTDNRNQPRKINIQRAFDDSYEFSGTNNPYYFNEDQVSVSKFAPYEAFSFLDASNNPTLISNSEEYLPAHIITTAVYTRATGLFTFSSPAYSTITQDANNPDLKAQATGVIGDKITVNDEDEYIVTSVTTLTATATSAINQYTDGITVKVMIQRANPEYNSSYKGDTNLLKDEFAKFSYRFKYEDDEYSLIAPFTQSAFVPQQFGYFINDDEQVTLESGNVSFMENRVDQVKLNLILPDLGSNIKNNLKISELQILVKNSDELAVRVIEDVPVSVLTALGATNKYQYNYLSSKPFKVLPEAELIRVFDKVPIRALTQEVVSNRVVYGNFLDKHSSPNNLHYDLNYNQKTYPSGSSDQDQANRNLSNEFPLHTLKQNRSYQVGIVLVDRYGRASNVLLNDENNVTAGSKNSTIYTSYENFGANSVNFTGNYLDLTLRSEVPLTLSKKGYPGLYSETNPLGYYSYRIVVKQQDQDYYNVYTPGALAGEIYWDTIGYTENNTDFPVANGAGNSEFLPSFISTNKLSTLTLSGDNINKVPRELNTISGNQDTFGSETLLFNRVNPIYNSTSSVSYNTQSSIGAQGSKVASIQSFRDLGRWTTTKGELYPGGINDAADSTTQNPIPWYPYFVSGSAAADFKFNFHDILFDAQANPFVAVIETVGFKIGSTPTYTDKSTIERAWQDLGVFETRPTKSVLDIFWESSSSGLISDFNNEVVNLVPKGIEDSAGNNTSLGQNVQYIHTEATASGADATLFFELVDAAGVKLTTNSTLAIDLVTDGTGADRSAEFQILTDNTGSVTKYKIQTNALFVFNSNANVNENYTFNLLATDTSASPTPLYTNAPIRISSCQLLDIAPIFNSNPPTVVTKPIGNLFTMTGDSFLNGSIDTSRNKEQLFLAVVDATTEALYPEIYVVPNTGSNQDRTIIASNLAVDGSYKLKLVDANGTGLSSLSSQFDVIITQ